MMLAFLATAAAVQMSASQEQALRLRLGALPALWKLEADIDSLQGYLESPKEAFLQMQKENGPDCECINKNQKGPECECINKAPVVLAKTEKGPDCECINKNQKGPDCECINKAPVVLAKADNATNATEADAPVDQQTTDLLKQAKNVDVKDMPMM